MGVKRKFYKRKKTRENFITPELKRVGWSKAKSLADNAHEYTFIEEHTYTQGRILLEENKISKGKQKRVDYLLFYPKTQKNLAVLEAKSLDNHESLGLEQTKIYARDLDAPFAYSTNGKSFVEYELIV